MTKDPFELRSRQVPRGRLARFGQFGRLAGSVAGGMAAEGARRLANGERPHLRDMLLTPANFGKVAERLSHLRGAAMKLGQMISMDAGDLLPAELSQIMGRLRDNAHHMPPSQLEQVLAREWGPDWRARFESFDTRPIAAASIGQVHRAVTRDGRDLAIKVQYPGVRESIDADVDNVATLLRMSGVLPKVFDITPLLAEAKSQLAEEADYEREGEQMALFGRLLADTPGVVVPTLDADLSTARVLAMTFLEGRPIETLETASQAARDAAMLTLMRLVLRELFEFGVMQTDPNFANYRIQPDTGRLVLLDFGAARPVAADTAEGYRRLLRTGLAGDRAAVRTAALGAGFLGATAVARHSPRIDRMIEVIIGELNRPGLFDFGDRRFVGALRDQGMEIAADTGAWHVPPADILFVQRKISGTALLAARLRARVDVRKLVQPWLEGSEDVGGLSSR
jgi:predicted unusual protein kinase regulating ubiquinone biosynthesis (AarF/ABC1/UbiB family)